MPEQDGTSDARKKEEGTVVSDLGDPGLWLPRCDISYSKRESKNIEGHGSPRSRI